jgi:hypothetical protein
MHWENLTDYYSAWAVYLLGATGCILAAWLLFRRLPRAFVHFFIITLMVLLFTPYAIDSKTMILAPGIVCLGYGLIIDGFTSVKPVLKTMVLFWTIAMVLSLVYQLLTRRKLINELDQQDYSERSDQDLHPNRNNSEPIKQEPIEPTINLHQIELSEPAIRAER